MKYYISEDKSIKLYNGDCLEVMDKLIKLGVKVDMILTDPPYGTINGIDNVNHGLSGRGKWDIKINTSEMFQKLEKVIREQGFIILFSQGTYTNELASVINEGIHFSYRYVWTKDHFANSLIAKKAPVSFFEDICVFKKVHDSTYDNELRKYFNKMFEFINKPKRDILSIVGQSADHCFRYNSNQFKLPTNETYDKLIENFKINNMSGYIEYNKLLDINKKYKPVFNLPDGQKYKSNVLSYKKDYNGFHPTQKPVALLEDLIKTYTNEGDVVLDFTMGSGSTGVACRNLNRKFIGIELDEKYFDISVNRIKEEK